MMKMNNLLYVNAFVKELQKIPRGKTSLYRRENSLRKSYHFARRVKRIFKKYGWTLQAVVLAAGLVIGAVSLATMNAIKNGTKAVDNGLKEIGKKVSSILPTTTGRSQKIKKNTFNDTHLSCRPWFSYCWTVISNPGNSFDWLWNCCKSRTCWRCGCFRFVVCWVYCNQ